MKVCSKVVSVATASNNNEDKTSIQKVESARKCRAKYRDEAASGGGGGGGSHAGQGLAYLLLTELI